MSSFSISQQAVSDQSQPLILTGGPITIEQVVTIASGGTVTLDPACASRIAASHAAVVQAADTGTAVYGVTTGVGALRGVQVSRAEARLFNRHLILSHRVSHGDPMPRSVVRATMLCRAQGLAQGGSGVRPAVIEALIDALNADDIPVVRMLGSVGQGDLAPLAEIAEALISRGLILEEREALALVGANSFTLGWATLALHRMQRAIYILEMATALTMEGFLSNPSAIDPAVFIAHPSPELERSVLRLRELLAGGTLLEGLEPPRLLQDPLSLRVAPQTHATAREAYRHTVSIVEQELAAASDNPLLTTDGRLVAVGNFDASGLAAVLDYARIGLAHALTLSCERVQKLLSGWHTGLPIGLRERADLPEDALAIFGHGAAALAAEARLLAQPVSFELPTSSVAESIEDRVTMAPLAARRLDEQAGLALRLAAVELVCAAQAVDLRKRQASLGRGTQAAYQLVRSHIPFVRAGDTPATNLEALFLALDSQLDSVM
ncbi:MAG TPA: aromatic amino acid ammonia-lyase [Ktedonosporobacter sp.]|nr:aromatic amino acid ammonia-lyase [Ktedonosporobacter sp.]